MADQPQESSIFESQEAQTSVSTPEVEPKETIVTDPYKELLSGIIDSDGRQKYDSVEKALNALPNANKHISTLEQELADLREELQKRATAEELLSKVQAGKEQTSSPTLDQNDIAKLVEATLTRKEAESSAKQNRDAVAKAMVNVYGDATKAEEAYKARSVELGVDLYALSSQSPTAALKLLGLDEKQARAPAKSQGSLNTTGFQQEAPKEKPRSVMGVSSTKEVLDKWRSCAPSQE